MDEQIEIKIYGAMRASEMRVNTLIRVNLALMRAGYDTVDAQKEMWREMEALATLRRQWFRMNVVEDL